MDQGRLSVSSCTKKQQIHQVKQKQTLQKGISFTNALQSTTGKKNKQKKKQRLILSPTLTADHHKKVLFCPCIIGSSLRFPSTHLIKKWFSPHCNICLAYRQLRTFAGDSQQQPVMALAARAGEELCSHPSRTSEFLLRRTTQAVII